MPVPVYMDHNATTPLRPKALEAIMAALEITGNASSVHRFGRTARQTMEKSREQVGAAIRARPQDIVFTSGGTEANNLALASRGNRRLIVSAIEHDSIRRPAHNAGATVVGVNRDGRIDVAQLEKALASDARPALVSVMLANNETGVIQPVREVVEVAAHHRSIVHCDASQALGRVAIDFAELGVDMLTLSSHKAGGPQGVGALVVKAGLDVTPQILGGGQERSRRAGTENLAAIVGFGVAAEEAARLRNVDIVRALRERLEQRLQSLGLPVTIFGSGVDRLPNTSCFASAGKSSETLVMALDLAGYAVSAGSACSSGKVKASHVIAAMGFDPKLAAGAIRVSLGEGNTEQEVEGFLSAYAEIQGINDRRMAGIQPAA